MITADQKAEYAAINESIDDAMRRFQNLRIRVGKGTRAKMEGQLQTRFRNLMNAQAINRRTLLNHRVKAPSKSKPRNPNNPNNPPPTLPVPTMPTNSSGLVSVRGVGRPNEEASRSISLSAVTVGSLLTQPRAMNPNMNDGKKIDTVVLNDRATAEFIISLARGNLSKLTHSQLRNVCRGLGIQYTGSKTQLLQRFPEHGVQ